MLYLKCLLQTNSCDDALKRAILSNSLVNTHGKDDSWQEIDLNIKHHNLLLKELLRARKNSTFTLNYLFHRVALTSTMIKNLQEKLELVVGETNNGSHIVKSATLDIHELAHFLAGDSIKLHRSGRECEHEAPDILGKSALLLEKTVKGFNDRVFYDPGVLQSIVEEIGPTEDLLRDVPLGDIEV
jgi:hypothetical protein